MSVAQETLFQILFNHLSEPHIVLKADPPAFTIVACNDAYEKIINTKERDIIGKPMKEIGNADEINIDNRTLIKDSLNRAIKENTVVKLPAVRYDLADINGNITEPTWWQTRYTPVCIEPGKVDYLLCTICDITDEVVSREAVKKANEKERAFYMVQTLNHELHQSQKDLFLLKNELEQRVIRRTKALAESEERFREMIQQCPVAMLVTRGPDMIFEVANQAMLDVLGKDASIIGKPTLEVMPELKGQPILDTLYNTYKTGKEWTGYEQPVTISRDGKAQNVYFNISFNPLFENGEIVGVLQSGIEVTEQVTARQATAESERKIRDILDTLPEIAWTNTPDGEVTFYNQQWYTYTGLDFETSRSWGWKEVIHPDDIQYNLDTLASILKNEKESEFEIRERRADGRYRWHLVRIRPFKIDGVVQLWVGTATDIHELKEVQQQKDDFISIASHELKTPITSLKASIQLLNRIKDDSFPKIALDLIKQSDKSMQKVSTLVEDLLNAGKYSQGHLKLRKTSFNIAQLVNDCCPNIRAEGIYSIKTEGDLSLQINADADRVDQVVINLVNNAVKYAPESKEIVITIEKANDMAKVTVTDQGPGIAADKLPHLFDRYYRIATNGYQNSGLGIGLYISKEIIKKHGGKIGVVSEPGKGSSFWFMLPIH